MSTMPTTKKILVVSHRVPYPPNKGEKLRTYHQIKALVAAGHEVEVLTPLERASEHQDAQQLSEQLGIRVLAVLNAYGRLKMLWGLLSNSALTVARFHCSRLLALLDTRLDQFQPDVVLLSASGLVEYAERVKTKRPDCALLMDFMDLDSEKWRAYAQQSRFVMAAIYAREYRLIRRAQWRCEALAERVFLVSDAESDELRREAQQPQKVLTVGNGIDSDEFYPQPDDKFEAARVADPSIKRFLFVGVMDYKPNVDAVVWFVERVWPKIVARQPDAEFRIVGMNPSTTVYRLGQVPGVVVTGKVPSVVEYFQSADLFVAPFSIARGIQNKILQAMACGLPVITTPVGAQGIDYVNNQELCIASTDEQYLHAIWQLEEQPNRYLAMRRAAIRLIAEQYSWEGRLRPLLASVNQLS